MLSASITVPLALFSTVSSHGRQNRLGKTIAHGESVIRESHSDTSTLDISRRKLKKKPKDNSDILFPGVMPENYAEGNPVPMLADLVESQKTHVPFEYYDLPVCPGPSVGVVHKMRKNLGSKLQGINIKPAPYMVSTLKNVPCTPLCMVKISNRKLKWMRKLIQRQYRVHVTLDGLPVLMRSTDTSINYAVRGFPVGFSSDASTTGKDVNFFLYNHLRFTISYNNDPDGTQIVGFVVHPVSIKHDKGDGPVKSDSVLSTCDKSTQVINEAGKYLELKADEKNGETEVVYSYEVEWVESKIPWTDRWDIYLVGSPDDEIHYFSIVNSLMIVVFLTGAVSIIMLRTLKKDIAAYNDIASMDDPQEESGWKLIHGDVFRPPQTYPMLLCVMFGTGMQIGTSIIITLLSGLVGILNPMNKGQTLSTIILLYVLSGSVAGYCTSRVYKFFDAKAWKRVTLLTAAAFPGLLVGMFCCLDVFLTFAGAATAVSVWTIIALFLLWVCVSTPLVFVGSYFGFRADKIEVPTKTNQIARFIPDTPWYTHAPITFLLGGILPFGSVSIELLFIMGALWLHQIYYALGFLLFVVLILAATCAEVAVCLNYLQISAEDHRWWWRSFVNAAASGFYLFLYSLWFLATKLSLSGFLATLVYLTYMSIISIVFGMFCGSVGFLSAFLFNLKIYAALKVD